MSNSPYSKEFGLFNLYMNLSINIMNFARFSEAPLGGIGRCTCDRCSRPSLSPLRIVEIENYVGLGVRTGLNDDTAAVIDSKFEVIPFEQGSDICTTGPSDWG